MVYEGSVGETDPGSWAMEGNVPGELRPTVLRKRIGDAFIADAFHWAPPEWPLLFDGAYQPKPAFEGFALGLLDD